MALNKPDRNEIIKTGLNEGYRWNSDHSKLIKGNSEINFSASGGSVYVDHNKHTDRHHATSKISKK